MCAPKCKMFFPSIMARMEESNDRTRVQVDAGDIRTFIEVAPTARPAQVVHGIASTMLLCNHMLKVEWPFIDLFRQSTILTPAAGTLPH